MRRSPASSRLRGKSEKTSQPFCAHLTDELDDLQIVQICKVPGRLGKEKVASQDSDPRTQQLMHSLLPCRHMERMDELSAGPPSQPVTHSLPNSQKSHMFYSTLTRPSGFKNGFTDILLKVNTVLRLKCASLNFRMTSTNAIQNNDPLHPPCIRPST